MPSAPLPPERGAESEDLERSIREAVDAEIGELAENLATTDDAHLFGDNEFTIRAIAHRLPPPGGRTAPGGEKNGYDGSSVTCPHCDGAAAFHSHREHTVVSPVGALRYRRA